jgi:hypothetical protein
MELDAARGTSVVGMTAAVATDCAANNKTTAIAKGSALHLRNSSATRSNSDLAKPITPNLQLDPAGTWTFWAYRHTEENFNQLSKGELAQ